MTMPENLKVLELFSGIGGMHTALKLSEVPGHVCAAVDINSVANEVYTHNFPRVKVLRKNIQNLTPDLLRKLGVNTILMSPPCQPFTRVGNKKGLADNRSLPLIHVLDILPDLLDVRFLLIENVTGFEDSEAGQQLRTTVQSAGFDFREMMISPIQLGIPNSRERYYMIATRSPPGFSTEDVPPHRGEQVSAEVVKLLKAAHPRPTPSTVSDILDLPNDSEDYDDYLVSEDVLKRRAWILDIVTKDSTKTCCFTKSYTHYVEGTGSVYCPLDELAVQQAYARLESLEPGTSEFLSTLKSLRLRFFTPSEVQKMLCFPDSFAYPPEVSNRQKYRLLGNSVNVDVVSRLIRMMAKRKVEDCS